MRLKVAATVMLVLTSCKSPSESVNRFHGDVFNAKHNIGDIMGTPGAVARKSEEAERAKPRMALEGVQLSAFRPTFKFDNGDILYEDGKGSAQIRRGKEIIHKGSVIGRHGNGTFTFLTKDNYEIIFHKDGLGTIVYEPQDILDRYRTSK